MIRGIVLGSLALATAVACVAVLRHEHLEDRRRDAERQRLLDAGALPVEYRVTGNAGIAAVSREDIDVVGLPQGRRRLPVHDAALLLPNQRVYLYAAGHGRLTCEIVVDGEVVAESTRDAGEDTAEVEVECEARVPGADRG
ncbi:hypothetical protein RM844_19650 [Streptomyces sp. DSM 44915]|uniref:Lipoprotein n=1 Tax=Streptomyces chisholmiae TaxID=3075540 RepID=A0ABU2JVC5_9ACTN|nr:hypothetical protein [Streptomyces sp. DSM 44915]MDT0268504.1 hypothetical protein [Streptomyces sp. DSM 44915]